jgi:hypothetical protein
MLHAPEFAPFPPRETARSLHPSDAIGPSVRSAKRRSNPTTSDQSSLGVDGPSATGRTVDAAISVDDRDLAHRSAAWERRCQQDGWVARYWCTGDGKDST